MAKVGKTSKRATLNVQTGEYNSKNTQKNAKKVAKNAKKLGVKGILIACCCLVLGVVVGVSAFFVVCKNDCFELVGNDEIYLTLKDSYTDEGVKIISFGKQVSYNVEGDSHLLQNEDGSYYSETEGTFSLIYTSEDFKYGTLFKIQKIRLITFEQSADDGRAEDEEV